MPRRYGYGGYTDPSEMQQMAGDNPFYNPMMNRPDWGAGIRSILNQITVAKEQKRQEDEKRQQWERQQALEEKQAASSMQLQQAQIQKILEKEPGPQAVDRIGIKTFLTQSVGWPKEQADALDGLTDEQINGLYNVVVKQKFGTTPEKITAKEPKEPTEYDKRLTWATGALKSGLITQDQFNQVAGGVNQPPPSKQESLLPQEVQDYMARHPKADLAIVLQLYKDFKSGK